MEVMEAIRSRRSVREFTAEPILDEDFEQLLEAARWAPSGLNNQPWRFMKVKDRTIIEKLSMLTKYRGVVAGAAAIIVVFLDNAEMYDRTKDLQSTGAAIQNMLLAAHERGLGATWLGEILNKREEVEALLEVPEDLELMAVVVLGHPVPRERTGVRHSLDELIIPPPSGNGDK